MKTWLSDKNRTGLIRQSQKQGLISSRLPGVLLLTRKYAFLYMSLPALCSAGILLLGRVPTQLLCSVPSSLGCQVQRILPGVAWACANPSFLLSSFLSPQYLLLQESGTRDLPLPRRARTVWRLRPSSGQSRAHRGR